MADKLLKMKSFPSRRDVSVTSSQLKKSILGLWERSAHYHSAVQMVLTDPLFNEYSTALNPHDTTDDI